MHSKDIDVDITLSKQELAKCFISDKNLQIIANNFYKFGVVAINGFLNQKLIKELNEAAESNLKFLFSKLKLNGYTEKDNISSREICSRGLGRL